LTYKDNIVDFDAPGTIVTRLLGHPQPSIPKLNNVYGAIMKVLNEMRVQITLKSHSLSLIVKAGTLIQRLLRFKQRILFFSLLTILNLLTGLV
jgi:hypothetical protein